MPFLMFDKTFKISYVLALSYGSFIGYQDKAFQKRKAIKRKETIDSDDSFYNYRNRELYPWKNS
jgi:hypothetical protein